MGCKFVLRLNTERSYKKADLATGRGGSGRGILTVFEDGSTGAQCA